MDYLGYQPVLDYLVLLHLPEVPSFFRNDTSNNNFEFDWVKTIATTKKLFGGDVIFGFDIFPDPTNRTKNRLVLGIPGTESVLPV